ncbi:hypothetical protein [Natrinema versiforme]|uniref:Uncharacterized protein n=1 Tax=Natrinema versiforme TaxID=88724 RepID=A0A4V1FZH0_9EURY|nr:hypothetical protein [Natrinema versiforme]QCS41816.1 hypothetical protein FEJ81_05390 [Natrinema versiforme]
MIDGIGSEIYWEQVAMSVFVSAVLVRDLLENRDSEEQVRSSIVSLVGCVLLAANGVIRPPGLVLLGPATICFITGLALHLSTRGWRSDGSTAH